MKKNGTAPYAVSRAGGVAGAYPPATGEVIGCVHEYRETRHIRIDFAPSCTRMKCMGNAHIFACIPDILNRNQTAFHTPAIRTKFLCYELAPHGLPRRFTMKSHASGSYTLKSRCISEPISDKHHLGTLRVRPGVVHHRLR